LISGRDSYGKIINLATIAFFLGVDNMAHYVASKGAIIGLTRAAARELGRDGIRVNAIAPGLTMNASLSAQAWSRARSARQSWSRARSGAKTCRKT
jgi:NAD(P)-dependent dehydrogenase (short-subunit alcohol dehydrogenase family)